MWSTMQQADASFQSIHCGVNEGTGDSVAHTQTETVYVGDCTHCTNTQYKDTSFTFVIDMYL